MQEIIRRAELLGELLRRDDRFKALRAAEKAVSDDGEARKLIEDVNDLSSKIGQKEEKGEPIEAEEKRSLAELRRTIAGHPKLKALSKAQADFAELMNRVNSAIREKLTAEDA